MFVELRRKQNVHFWPWPVSRINMLSLVSEALVHIWSFPVIFTTKKNNNKHGHFDFFVFCESGIFGYFGRAFVVSVLDKPESLYGVRTVFLSNSFQFSRLEVCKFSRLEVFKFSRLEVLKFEFPSSH